MRKPLSRLRALRYATLHGEEIAPGEPNAERDDFGELILAERLRDALWPLNLRLPDEACEEAFRKVSLLDSPSVVENNRASHKMLIDGVPVQC